MCFAPYAFDASVWAGDAAPLVSLADEGTSLVAKLTTDQQQELTSLDGALRLVPKRQWRRGRSQA